MTQHAEDEISIRIGRLVFLLPWLAANPDATAEEAASRFGVTEQQLMQDVLLLTMTGPNQYGGGLVDIAYDHRILTVRDAKGLATPVIKDARGFYPLILALELLAASMSDSESSITRGLIAKLKASAKLPEPVIAVAESDAHKSFSEDRRLFAEAITGHKAVEFTYSGPEGEGSTRWVLPRNLGLNEGLWYLSGWDLDKKADRLFRLDRIVNLQISSRAPDETHWSPQTGPDVDGEKLASSFFTITMNASGVTALEDFSNWQILESTKQQIRVQFPRYRDEWAIQTVLSLWPWVDEIEPSDLKEMIVSRLRRIQASYKT